MRLLLDWHRRGLGLILQLNLGVGGYDGAIGQQQHSIDGIRRPVAEGDPGSCSLRPGASTASPGVTGVTGMADGPGGANETKAPTVSREQLAALRKELNGLVGAWSHRTGQPHGVIHNELRSACGGPALPQASAEQIRARIDKIRQWALSRR